jgi:hypothetical protein
VDRDRSHGLTDRHQATIAAPPDGAATLKLALQIAAGMLIAGMIAWIGSCTLAAGALTAVTATVKDASGRAIADAQNATEQARIRAAEQEEARARIEQQRTMAEDAALRARCSVTTATGRTLSCADEPPCAYINGRPIHLCAH